jgi:hypothetical protein
MALQRPQKNKDNIRDIWKHNPQITNIRYYNQIIKNNNIVEQLNIKEKK